ncbi:peptidoglycan DD-metalloendopeptidase family protein [Streptomyces sp. YIM 98790]|uniref:M23 family metallopeptidase n=1 Tax=Streptomyces sp. YIM 98790 TaxID=2689077 RepID=UPI00140DE0A2|nr:peptidoglycan DD-metalloendopeptidase family protein [Streptomyces sp. YIM 98790]
MRRNRPDHTTLPAAPAHPAGPGGPAARSGTPVTVLTPLAPDVSGRTGRAVRRPAAVALPLACCAVLLLAGPAAAAPAPDRGSPGSQTPEAMAEEVERLREEAAEASERHEMLRRLGVQQQRALGRMRDGLEEERERVRLLRAMIGRQAASQYRAGGGTGSGELARLLLADTPEDMLAEAQLVGRGELGVRQLLEETERAETQLARNEETAGALSDSLSLLEEEQSRILASVAEKLARAEERLAELERARRTALDGADAGTPGACAVSLRDTGGLAGPAVDTEWTAPVAAEDYRLSAGYGQAGEHWADRHTGQDFAVDSGTPVLAVGSGTVVAAECGDGFGHQVVIRHDNGYYSQYAHLSVLEVGPGTRVGTGQRIGLSGNTGNSSGPHLHFEIRLTPYLGSGIDPVPWLRDHGVTLPPPG